MIELYFATINIVLPPGHVDNKSRYQYEYVVTVTMKNYSTMPATAIRMDPYGTNDNYEDVIYRPGDRVFVMFPRGDRSQGIIWGGSRTYPKPMDGALHRYYRQRYNKIETFIDKDGNWSVTSDSGPHAHVNTDKIILDDSAGEQVILDKANKTLTLNTKEWVVNVTGSAKISVAQDAEITVKNKATVRAGSLTATIDGSAEVSCKDLTAKASNNATVEAGTKAKVKAPMVELNEGGTGVTTESSHFGVVDFITGVPVNASKTVKADV